MTSQFLFLAGRAILQQQQPSRPQRLGQQIPRITRRAFLATTAQVCESQVRYPHSKTRGKGGMAENKNEFTWNVKLAFRHRVEAVVHFHYCCCFHRTRRLEAERDEQEARVGHQHGGHDARAQRTQTLGLQTHASECAAPLRCDEQFLSIKWER